MVHESGAGGGWSLVPPQMLEPENQPSDANLIALARSGQTAAFAEIVDRYKDSLVGYLVRLLCDRERAEDLAQDAFLRLYQRGGAYEERGQLKAYLFRIATNQLRSEERRARRWDKIHFLRPKSKHCCTTNSNASCSRPSPRSRSATGPPSFSTK